MRERMSLGISVSGRKTFSSRMAEKHWREHRPKMVRELEQTGRLHQMLLEAEEKTKDEMATLRMDLMQKGSTAQQAHDQAWEMVREKYILLPPEE
jgi:hypothetical protein